MIKLEHKELLNAGVHFGHLAKKWNPNMAPFIFMKRNGIHIIDLNKTIECLHQAATQLNVIVRSGKKIMFVATKKQAKDYVAREAQKLGMPYMTERWLGGTLTNFATIRKLLKKMSSIDKMMQSTAYKNLAKKEKLMITREQQKLNRILQGIANVTRLPAALFVVDINREHIAIKEAIILGIPIFALADTNVNPDLVDWPIPSNDDALRSVEITVSYICNAIKEGLEAYKKEKLESASQVVDNRKVAKTDSQKNLSPSQVEKYAPSTRRILAGGQSRRERVPALSAKKEIVVASRKMSVQAVKRGSELSKISEKAPETVTQFEQTKANYKVKVTKELGKLASEKKATEVKKVAPKEEKVVSQKATEVEKVAPKEKKVAKVTKVALESQATLDSLVTPSKEIVTKGPQQVISKKTIDEAATKKVVVAKVVEAQGKIPTKAACNQNHTTSN